MIPKKQLTTSLLSILNVQIFLILPIISWALWVSKALRNQIMIQMTVKAFLNHNFLFRKVIKKELRLLQMLTINLKWKEIPMLLLLAIQQSKKVKKSKQFHGHMSGNFLPIETCKIKQEFHKFHMWECLWPYSSPWFAVFFITELAKTKLECKIEMVPYFS